MAEASLKEKTLELNVMEQLAMTSEKALELAEQKANDVVSRLGKTELKIVETSSLLSTQDKEFTDYKGGEKAWKQSYYNKGFRHAKNLVRPVIFLTRKLLGYVHLNPIV